MLHSVTSGNTCHMGSHKNLNTCHHTQVNIHTPPNYTIFFGSWLFADLQVQVQFQVGKFGSAPTTKRTQSQVHYKLSQVK